MRLAISRVNHKNQVKKKCSVWNGKYYICLFAATHLHIENQKIVIFLSLSFGRPKKKKKMLCWERGSVRISKWLTAISCKHVAHVSTIHVNSTYVFHINFSKLLQFHSVLDFSAMRKRFPNENIHARTAYVNENRIGNCWYLFQQHIVIIYMCI